MPYSINLTFGTFAELVFACIMVLLALRFGRFGRLVFVQASVIAHRLAKRPVLLVILAGVTPVIIRIAILPLVPVPDPHVMEEFNHLFLTQTYDLGRLTNPVHPLAVMVQTYQQIEWPHYISARPPLPPIFLFIGQAVFGSPFAGSLLALGLTSAALCWAMLGWAKGRWAALASFLAIVTFCLFGYWINSYWAPTTIVLGGALLFGAVPRIETRPRFTMAIVCVAALVLLAGTRPYENGVFAAVICGWLAYRFLQRERRHMLLRAIFIVVVPMAIGVTGIIAAQLWYNHTTTGNLALMPYQIWRESQDMAPYFLWQPIEESREFFNSGAKRFAQWNVFVVKKVTDGGIMGFAYWISRHAVTFRDLLGPFLFLAFACWSPRWIGTPSTKDHTRQYAMFILLGLCLLALGGPGAGAVVNLAAIFVLVKRWANHDERLAVMLLLIGMAATMLPAFYMTVYFAAYTAPLLLLVATGMRNLSRWHRPVGKSLAGFALLGAALFPVGQLIVSGAKQAGLPIEQLGPPLSHFEHRLVNPRKEVIEQLAPLPGEHVVFVQLTKLTFAPVDPMWNSPEIDAQKIVWLRDIKPEWTATAMEYYAGRTFWAMKVRQDGEYSLERFAPREGVVPVPLESLPNPDRKAAERLGAQQLKE